MMQRVTALSAFAFAALSSFSTAAMAAATTDELAAICDGLFAPVYGIPNAEPLGVCQWNMALVNATEGGSYSVATGLGVKVGIIDSHLLLLFPQKDVSLHPTNSCIVEDTIAAILFHD